MNNSVLEFFQLDSVQVALLDLWGRVVDVLPTLIGATFIIILGLIVSPLLGGVVKKFLDILRIDAHLERAGVHDLLRGFSPKLSVSLLVGKLIKWFFLLVFVMAAADILEWDRVTEFLDKIIFYIPDVLVAIAILVIGVVAGNFVKVIVERSIHGSGTPVRSPVGFGLLAKWSVVIFALLAALIQLDIAPSLIEILFAGVIFALALAFGLGGKEKAAKLLDHFGPSTGRNGSKK